MTETQESIQVPVSWVFHNINIRLTSPGVRAGWYLSILGGTERRDTSRRVSDRERHLSWRIGNVLFAIRLVAIFYGLVILAIALQTSMIDF